jgi:hypothetical protein
LRIWMLEFMPSSSSKSLILRLSPMTSGARVCSVSGRGLVLTYHKN